MTQGMVLGPLARLGLHGGSAAPRKGDLRSVVDSGAMKTESNVRKVYFSGLKAGSFSAGYTSAQLENS